MNMRRDELVELSLRELGSCSRKQASEITERGGGEGNEGHVFAPAGDRCRASGKQDSVPESFSCGDWTATGWPFTMEGAVRSGYRAAKLVAEAANQPQKFMVPDLPAAPLMRLFKKP